MSVYSTQLFAGQIPSGVTTLWTVAPNTVVVVRDIEAYGNVSASTSLLIGANVSGSLDAPIRYFNPFAPGDWYQWTGRAVLEAGNLLQADAGAGSPWLLVSGYVLS